MEYMFYEYIGKDINPLIFVAIDISVFWSKIFRVATSRPEF
jgi:hypothetical protein